MMKLFRNPEVRRGALLFCGVCVAATVAAYVWEKRFGIFTLVLCALLMAVYLIITNRRYRRICDLSADIDRILHDEDARISLDRYAEGELAILQSEVHKMTARLREQRRQLQDDKTYLADSIADISHQIRTPLTSINLLVQLLSEKDMPQHRRTELTHELMSLLSRIDWLITTLLKISRLDAGTVQLKRETVPLSVLIAKATAPLLVPVELREQSLTVSAEGDFTGDVAWTQEAIGNIVKNCMEHTPAGGRLEINAGENALFSEITISDNGSGIDKEDLPHIFERFYKGKNSDAGSFGIGLALSRTIITSQNGTIKVDNKSDGGVRFTIRFYKGTV